MKTVMRSIVILLAFTAGAMAQVTTTTITGPVIDPFNNPYSGTILVQSQAKTNFGYAITGTVQTVVVSGGVISGLSLTPNDVAVPNLTSYAMTFGNGDRWVCIVPTVASPVSTTASITVSSPTITVASAAGITTGQLVGGAGIPNNTKVTGISGMTITLSQSATATASGISVTFTATVNFATICYPNTIPPTAPAPLPVSLILPSPTQYNVIATIAGQATWASVPSLFTGCSSTAPLLSWTGACVGNGGFPSTPASTQFWYSDANGNPVGDSLVTHVAGGLSIGGSTGSPFSLTNSGGTNLANPVLTPTLANYQILLDLYPSGTQNDARILVHNSSDPLNTAQLRMEISGSTAFTNLSLTGSGTPVTSWMFGETQNTGNHLLSINYQFNGATMASLSKIGAASFGLSAPSAGTMLQITTPTNAGPGTISVTATSGAVTGTGTSFLETYQNGDQISANAETHTITAIASDTSMTTDVWTSSFSGAYTSNYPVDGSLKWSFDQSGRLVFTNTTISAPRTYLALAPTLTSPTNTHLVRVQPTFNNASGNAISINSEVTLNSTSAAFPSIAVGVIGGAIVGSTNTQNWTSTSIGAATGLWGRFIVGPGATGVVTNGNSITLDWQHSASGATVTNGYMLHTFADGSYQPVSAVSLALNSFTGSSNTNYILIGTDTPQAGTWGIYDASGYAWHAGGSITAVGTVAADNGTNTVYRCATARTLPAGALTIAAGNCGSTTDSGLRIQ